MQRPLVRLSLTSSLISLSLYLPFDDILLFPFLGRNLLLAQIEQLCANTGQILSSELIHSVLSFLRKSEDLSMHLDSFLQFLSSAQPRDDFSFALTPMLAQQVHEAPVFRCCL